MIFSENDIKQMVVESIEKLFETHHVLDDKLEEFAGLILEIAYAGGGTISADVVNRYNIYFKTNRDLKVVVEKRCDSLAYYDRINNIFGIAEKTLKSTKNKEIVMHELSHFVDQNARTKIDTETTTMPKLHFVDLALYYYRATEMQARLNEYAFRIKRNPILARYKINSSMTNLHIDDMRYILQMAENANFYHNSDPSWAMVVGIAYALAINKSMRKNKVNSASDVKSRFTNYINVKKITENDFEIRKKSVIKFLEKRLRSFTNKALKIKYDALQANQSKQ